MGRAWQEGSLRAPMCTEMCRPPPSHLPSGELACTHVHRSMQTPLARRPRSPSSSHTCRRRRSVHHSSSTGVAEVDTCGGARIAANADSHDEASSASAPRGGLIPLEVTEEEDDDDEQQAG